MTRLKVLRFLKAKLEAPYVVSSFFNRPVGADTPSLAFSAQKIILGAMNPGSSQSLLAQTTPKGQFPVAIAACIGLIVFGTSPILFACPSAPTLSFFEAFPAWRMLGRVFLAIIIVGAVIMTGWLDGERGAAKVMRCCGFVLLATLLTELHFHMVDNSFQLNWQIDQYNGIFLHNYPPPDQYRFLPQGMLWWMILCNGDFIFSYLCYRFFFTFLVCQCAYTLARLFVSPRDSIIVVLFYAVFYPLATRHYYGNLLDPMSQTVMLAALICCQRQQFWQMFWLFALGMFVKETMLLIAPCYYLMNPESFRLRNPHVLMRLALLAATGVGVFLACRLPFHFHCDFSSLNRTSGLMVLSNFGLPGGPGLSTVSTFERFMHPILFLFMWLPLIVWQRKLLPPALFGTALYLTAAFYLTNLCFSWNYESRNFVPALIFLLICTMIIVNRLLEARPPGASVAKP